MMSQTEARTGDHRNPRQRHSAPTAADAKATLRDEIAQLCDGLNAHSPQYWRWVKARALRGELVRLERTCQRVLSEPPKRRLRKMFI